MIQMCLLSAESKMALTFGLAEQKKQFNADVTQMFVV